MKSLPIRRQTYTDRQRYITYVLWLHGSTQAAIAPRVGLRLKQVAGIIARSEYTNRAALTHAERQAKLDELALIRHEPGGVTLDGGVLPDAVFKARKILGG